MYKLIYMKASRILFLVFLMFSFIKLFAQEDKKREMSAFLNYVIDSVIIVKHPNDRSPGVYRPPFILKSKTVPLDETLVNDIDFNTHTKDSVISWLRKDSLREAINSTEGIDISDFTYCRTNLLLSNYLTTDSLLLNRLAGEFISVLLSTPVFMQNGKYAIVYIGFASGFSKKSFGLGATILVLRREKTNWQVIKYLWGWQF